MRDLRLEWEILPLVFLSVFDLVDLHGQRKLRCPLERRMSGKFLFLDSIKEKSDDPLVFRMLTKLVDCWTCGNFSIQIEREAPFLMERRLKGEKLFFMVVLMLRKLTNHRGYWISQ